MVAKLKLKALFGIWEAKEREGIKREGRGWEGRGLKGLPSPCLRV